jgi:hypothetical protein
MSRHLDKIDEQLGRIQDVLKIKLIVASGKC